MNNLSFPTLPHLHIVQAWGNPNAKMYANGRHMGVDISGPVGSAIYAAVAGIVELSSLVDAHGYGRHVIIGHGTFKTLYAHLSKVNVTDGSILGAGSVIGAMGGDPKDADKVDGASTGPHLHFEVILPNQPKTDFIKTFAGYTVDPFPYLLQRFAAPAVKIGTVKEPQGVRVRISAGTGTKDTIIGAVGKNEKIEIAETKYVDGDLWCRIRSLRPEWVCAVYQKREYIKLEDVVVLNDAPTDEADDSVPPPPSTEKAIRLDELNRLAAYLEERKSELA
jgi:hypothetical protein